ncbi:sensor histidine kinase [Leifsonia sp. 2MCAF36]|uniref:sensor histidine kinase n=1 Tax=Leifsonia sp. 2MCAF36 TaxID=3232988 RepID=UPI003F970084
MKQHGEEWPRLVWYLRGHLLDRVVFVASILAVLTEACVLLLSGFSPVGFVGIAFSAAGVIVSRRYPVCGLVLVVAGAVASALYSDEAVAAWTIVAMTLFSATVRGARALVASILSAVVVYLAIVYRQGSWGAPDALIAATLIVAFGATGVAVRAQQRYWETLRQRTADAIATRDIEAERRVAEERIRIARDLHDAVGHEVAVISMNLGAAEVCLGSDTSAARGALQAARAGVQEVLHEIQHILDILRRGDTTAERVGPVPAASQIAVLARAFADAGMLIDERIQLDLDDAIDQGVSVAAFRFVQEALTNAQKHGVGTVALTAQTEGSRMRLRVENDRDPARVGATLRDGYGLVGMRERVESVGGRLSIEDEASRFQVSAVMDMRGRVVT